MRAGVELDRQAHEYAMVQHDQLLEMAREVAASGLRQLVSTEVAVETEEYSHSLHLLGEVGEAALTIGLDNPEGKVLLGALRESFDSSLIEMLHTDREFRRMLEINRERRHNVINGKVMAHDGKTEMVALCRNGTKSARLEAQSDARMLPVAERCGADERTALAVERLPVGHVHVGLSNYPIEAMRQHGEKFYDDLGFRKGLAFIQWYYRVDEYTLIAASYSVDSSDIETWRKVWSEFGGTIPQGLATDTWLDHSLQRRCQESEARAAVIRIRERFYQERGINARRFSTDEFMAINKEATDQMFALYVELAKDYHRGVKGPALHALVAGLLQNPLGLNKDIQTKLWNIYHQDELHKKSALLIEQLIRYATAERLRTGLQWVGSRQRPVVGALLAPPGMDPIQYLAAHSADHIMNGARAGRTYGGCTRSIDLSENPDYSQSDEASLQEAFGGRGGSGEASSSRSSEVCVYEHTGCYCCAYDDDLNPLDTPMKVLAKKRPGIATCLRPGCGAYMILNDKGNPTKIEKGLIYADAQRKQAREIKLKKLAAAAIEPQLTAAGATT